MSKRSQLKKYIPLSLLLHTSALIATGLIAKPYLDKNISQLEMGGELIEAADLSDSETLGVDVIASQAQTAPMTEQSIQSETTTAATSVAVPTPKVQESLPTKIAAKVVSEELTLPPAPIHASASAATATAATTAATPPVSAEPEPAEASPLSEETPVIAQQSPPTPEQTPSEPPQSNTANSIASTATEAPENVSTETSQESVVAATTHAENAQNQNLVLNSPQIQEGQGAGLNGENIAEAELAGAAQGVKSLEQLRQRPGNPKPRYDRVERIRKDQGTVVFKALIDKSGLPVKFEKITSSGHENLDNKSLAALKKWKFEPGQQGWVEVPFKWELSGEELSGQNPLRTSSVNAPE